MEFPIEIAKCPKCGCKDTVSRLACADEPSIPKGTFTSLEKKVVPIQDLNKITTPTVKTILSHFDVCPKCGTYYCTKAEITSLPVTIQKQPGQPLRGYLPPR